MRFNISTALYCVEMQPSTSGEILSKPDDTVRENGGLEPSRENDVTVVAMVDLDNDADSQYEGRFLILAIFSHITCCREVKNVK